MTVARNENQDCMWKIDVYISYLKMINNQAHGTTFPIVLWGFEQEL